MNLHEDTMVWWRWWSELNDTPLYYWRKMSIANKLYTVSQIKTQQLSLQWISIMIRVKKHLLLMLLSQSQSIKTWFWNFFGSPMIEHTLTTICQTFWCYHIWWYKFIIFDFYLIFFLQFLVFINVLTRVLVMHLLLLYR